MVPAAIPASRAMSDTRELQYPFRANTRIAASMICWGLSGSRISRWLNRGSFYEGPWRLSNARPIRARPSVALCHRRVCRVLVALTSELCPRTIRAHDDDQVPHRDHAGAMAGGTRRRRVPVDALRCPRAGRHRLDLAL